MSRISLSALGQTPRTRPAPARHSSPRPPGRRAAGRRLGQLDGFGHAAEIGQHAQGHVAHRRRGDDPAVVARLGFVNHDQHDIFGTDGRHEGHKRPQILVAVAAARNRPFWAVPVLPPISRPGIWAERPVPVFLVHHLAHHALGRCGPPSASKNPVGRAVGHGSGRLGHEGQGLVDAVVGQDQEGLGHLGRGSQPRPGRRRRWARSRGDQALRGRSRPLPSPEMGRPEGRPKPSFSK